MRDISIINEVIVHCSDTRIDQNFSINDIRRWHLERGWSDVGYHYYIRLSGEIEHGRPINIKGAHVRGRNSKSIGVCFEGGKLSNGDKWITPNSRQICTFRELMDSFDNVLGKYLPVNPHNKYDKNKSCPNFDISKL